MGKVLSRSGDSLADVYDVAGSIAGIDNLETADVNLVHEMGATLFSERLAGRIITISTGAIAQSITFDDQFTVLETSRILGVQIVTDNPVRIANVQLSVTSPVNINDTDLPLVTWEAGGADTTARVRVAGTTANMRILQPIAPMGNLPSLMVSAESDSPVTLLSLRGVSTAFGAGTVLIRALIYLGFSQPGGLSNRGLPLPSW